MGGAMAEGLLQSEKFTPSDITVSDHNQPVLDHFASKGASVTLDNQLACHEANIVCVVVKPWCVEKTLKGIKEVLDYKSQKLVVVAAGVPSADIKEWLDKEGSTPTFFLVMPDPDHVIWPGPYWFFGLMMQLYIVYRLLLWRKGDVYALLLIAVCWAMQAFCDPEGDTLNRVRYNFMGGVLPFCAGLLYARHGKQLTHGVRMTLMVISVVAVFFFSFNFQTWLWVPLFVCTASIGIVKLLPKTVNEWIAWVGTISAALFVLHPLTRKIFIPISRHGDVYTGLLLYIVASIALAWFYHNFKLRNEDTKH